MLAESQEDPEMGVPGFHRGKAKGLRAGEGVSESSGSEEDSHENEAGKSLQGRSRTKQAVQSGQEGCFQDEQWN